MKTRIFSSTLLFMSFIICTNSCKKEEKPVLATINTIETSNITLNSARCQCSIENDGGSTVTDRGVCWGLEKSPTTSNYTVSNGSGIGEYICSLTSLSPGTIYHVRGYAINSVGTSYGSELTFTTKSITAPILTLVTPTNISQTTAVSGGTVTEDGGASVISRGVCWSATSNPTISDNKTNDGSGDGSYESTISNLTPNTKYYIRAYATNAAGTSYSNSRDFTTLPITAPKLTTKGVTSISQSTAKSGGISINDGGSSITSKGVCWSTSHNPTVDDSHTINGVGSGDFSSSITGLEAYTKYYVRAYAVNSEGIGYGPEEEFLTLKYEVGQLYGGGVIFYVDGTGKHGLVMATADQSADAYWYNGTYIVTGANGKAIGTGKSNTEKIVSVLGNGSYAAKICFDLTRNGYSDWFLPSKDELAEMFDLSGTYALPEYDYFWASTESGGSGWGSGAWSSSKYFGGYNGANITSGVRAIREF